MNCVICNLLTLDLPSKGVHYCTNSLCSQLGLVRFTCCNSPANNSYNHYC